MSPPATGSGSTPTLATAASRGIPARTRNEGTRARVSASEATPAMNKPYVRMLGVSVTGPPPFRRLGVGSEATGVQAPERRGVSRRPRRPRPALGRGAKDGPAPASSPVATTVPPRPGLDQQRILALGEPPDRDFALVHDAVRDDALRQSEERVDPPRGDPSRLMLTRWKEPTGAVGSSANEAVVNPARLSLRGILPSPVAPPALAKESSRSGLPRSWPSACTPASAPRAPT